MEEEASKSETNDLVNDDAALCANLRKQANQIKELTNRITTVSRSEIYFSHDPIIHKGLIQNMSRWQKELGRLKEHISELCCPLEIGALHASNLNKNQVKRPFR
ncbi:hypothetical protein AVEN_65479-1 [Araneus ventricosus]|uniref:Uncharacterized protein n=1 Tax=Araneus ventricosus TaxID=182803 RepID=A0A4Y2R4J4_ARAVE|nr:hypothetical protein AVEN_65479-1 [Araneus ventricosus]